MRLDILGKAPFFQLVGIELEKTSSSATAAGFSPHTVLLIRCQWAGKAAKQVYHKLRQKDRGSDAASRTFLQRKGSVLVQPLSLTSFDSSPSRGASGETVHFAGTAKASPTRGGGSASALTERLYEDGPALCSKARPFAPYRALGVQWKVTRPAKGSPSGRAVTEGD